MQMSSARSYQTSPLQAAISLQDGKQWTDEAMAPRQMRRFYIQHLPSPGLTMHGGTTDRDTCWPCRHTQGVPHTGKCTSPSATTSERRLPTWWNPGCYRARAIRWTVTWCHRMVVTRKHDSSPRRTVDLSPLNKICRRETYAMESFFQLSRRIPKDSWKTVTNAWNENHSVPLRMSDRHLTTFITPFGRWRYTQAPQGSSPPGTVIIAALIPSWRNLREKSDVLMTQSIMKATLNSIGGGQLISSPAWAKPALSSTLTSSSLQRDAWTLTLLGSG